MRIISYNSSLVFDGDDLQSVANPYAALILQSAEFLPPVCGVKDNLDVLWLHSDTIQIELEIIKNDKIVLGDVDALGYYIAYDEAQMFDRIVVVPEEILKHLVKEKKRSGDTVAKDRFLALFTKVAIHEMGHCLASITRVPGGFPGRIYKLDDFINSQPRSPLEHPLRDLWYGAINTRDKLNNSCADGTYSWYNFLDKYPAYKAIEESLCNAWALAFDWSQSDREYLESFVLRQPDNYVSGKRWLKNLNRIGVLRSLRAWGEFKYRYADNIASVHQIFMKYKLSPPFAELCADLRDRDKATHNYAIKSIPDLGSQEADCNVDFEALYLGCLEKVKSQSRLTKAHLDKINEVIKSWK